MDLVERYLAAVGRELPEAQREDIVAELRDLLLSQVEEKEAEIGRPLETPEMEALLRGFGHPLAVAGRYRKLQRLIGPDAFPFYLRGLKAAMLITLVLHVVVAVLRLASGVEPWRALAGLLDSLVFGLLVVAGAVTLAFAAIEHAGGLRFLLRWRARDLPPAHVRKRKDGFEIAFDTVIDLVFLAWWTGAVDFARLPPMGPVAIEARLAPVWESFYWLVLAVPVASLAANMLLLLRPAEVRLNAAVGLAANGYTAVLAFILLTLGPWVVVEGARIGEAAAIWRVTLLNGFVFAVLAFVAVVHTIEAVQDARRLSGTASNAFGRAARN